MAVTDPLLASEIPWGPSVQEADRPLPVLPPQWLDVNAQLEAMQLEDAEAATGRRVWLSLTAIDDQIGGIRRGEVCGLMARPGIGKTLMLCHVAQAVTESAWHVFFSLEMP